jgi:hypothetical protein
VNNKFSFYGFFFLVLTNGGPYPGISLLQNCFQNIRFSLALCPSHFFNISRHFGRHLCFILQART